MMKVYTAVLLLLLLASCSDDATSPNSADVNLIVNPSFEEGGNPSLKGWTVTGNTTTPEDAPPGGGKYSAAIAEVWGPPGSVSQAFRLKEGRRVVNLRFWSRTTNLPAEVSVTIFGDTVSYYRNMSVSDTVWTSFSFSDTVTAAPGDSIIVAFTGSISQLLQSKALYDECSLTID